MKALLAITAIFCLFTLTSWTYGYKKEIKGSGIEKNEQRSVSTFHAREVSRAIKVSIKQGPQAPLLVEADDNILPYIKTEVKEETLYISLPNDISVNTRNPMEIEITVPELTFLSATTAAQVESESPWEVHKLDITATTAAKIEMDVKAEDITVNLTTAAQLELEGSAKHFNAKLTTSAEVDAADFSAEIAEITATTASDIKIRVNESLQYSVTTGSSIKYLGNPQISGSNGSGGSIRQIR